MHYAVATLVTTMVGIGIFGIPFSFVKAGFLTGILFLAGLAFASLIKNLMYGEIILRTKSKHQILGYVNKYLGNGYERFLLFSFMLGIYGTLLAITSIAGTFWTNVFSFINLSSFYFSIIFYFVVSIVIFRGLRTASRMDFVLMVFFVLTVLVIAVLGAGSINVENYKSVFNEEFWFLPFGVIMFALAGAPAIPLMREVLGSSAVRLKKAISVGAVVPVLLYLVFALVVVGVSGEITTPDAISGLVSFLGIKTVILGSFLGLFSTFTVFTNLAVALRESYENDFNISKKHSFWLVIVPPMFLFLSGLRNFIEIIGLVGAVAVSIETAMMMLAYVKAKKRGDRRPEYSLAMPAWFVYLLIVFFLSGAGYALVFF